MDVSARPADICLVVCIAILNLYYRVVPFVDQLYTLQFTSMFREPMNTINLFDVFLIKINAFFFSF